MLWQQNLSLFWLNPQPEVSLGPPDQNRQMGCPVPGLGRPRREGQGWAVPPLSPSSRIELGAPKSHTRPLLLSSPVLLTYGWGSPPSRPKTPLSCQGHSALLPTASITGPHHPFLQTGEEALGPIDMIQARPSFPQWMGPPASLCVSLQLKEGWSFYPVFLGGETEAQGTMTHPGKDMRSISQWDSSLLPLPPWATGCLLAGVTLASPLGRGEPGEGTLLRGPCWAILQRSPTFPSFISHFTLVIFLLA